MPGLVISAGSTRADSGMDLDVDIDRRLDDVQRSLHGRVVGFPGSQTQSGPGNFDASVLRQLSDLLLLPAAMMHPQERAFAVDLIHSGLDCADTDTRRDLAARLARAGSVAPSLVARLVRDRELPAAQPLLRHGLSVSDQDLIDIIREGCPERAYQIAGRHSLGAAVASEIATTAPNIAVYAALRNGGSELTATTLSRMAVRARSDPSLLEPLLKRPEMTPACALDLFWSAGRALRIYVIRRFLAESGMIRRILDGQDGAVRLSGHDDEGTRMESLQSRIAVVIDSVARGHFEEAAVDLADLTGISLTTAQHLVWDSSGEAMAVALKAAGATRMTFAAAVQRWYDTEDGVFDKSEGLDDLLELFDRLSRGHAMMAMTYWNWRENGSGPYAAGDNQPSGLHHHLDA